MSTHRAVKSTTKNPSSSMNKTKQDSRSKSPRVKSNQDSTKTKTKIKTVSSSEVSNKNKQMSITMTPEELELLQTLKKTEKTGANTDKLSNTKKTVSSKGISLDSKRRKGSSKSSSNRESVERSRDPSSEKPQNDKSKSSKKKKLVIDEESEEQEEEHEGDEVVEQEIEQPIDLSIPDPVTNLIRDSNGMLIPRGEVSHTGEKVKNLGGKSSTQAEKLGESTKKIVQKKKSQGESTNVNEDLPMIEEKDSNENTRLENILDRMFEDSENDIQINVKRIDKDDRYITSQSLDVNEGYGRESLASQKSFKSMERLESLREPPNRKVLENRGQLSGEKENKGYMEEESQVYKVVVLEGTSSEEPSEEILSSEFLGIRRPKNIEKNREEQKKKLQNWMDKNRTKPEEPIEILSELNKEGEAVNINKEESLNEKSNGFPSTQMILTEPLFTQFVITPQNQSIIEEEIKGLSKNHPAEYSSEVSRISDKGTTSMNASISSFRPPHLTQAVLTQSNNKTSEEHESEQDFVEKSLNLRGSDYITAHQTIEDSQQWNMIYMSQSQERREETKGTQMEIEATNPESDGVDTLENIKHLEEISEIEITGVRVSGRLNEESDESHLRAPSQDQQFMESQELGGIPKEVRFAEILSSLEKKVKENKNRSDQGDSEHSGILENINELAEIDEGKNQEARDSDEEIDVEIGKGLPPNDNGQIRNNLTEDSEEERSGNEEQEERVIMPQEGSSLEEKEREERNNQNEIEEMQIEEPKESFNVPQSSSEEIIQEVHVIMTESQIQPISIDEEDQVSESSDEIVEVITQARSQPVQKEVIITTITTEESQERILIESQKSKGEIREERNKKVSNKRDLESQSAVSVESSLHISEINSKGSQIRNKVEALSHVSQEGEEEQPKEDISDGNMEDWILSKEKTPSIDENMEDWILSKEQVPTRKGVLTRSRTKNSRQKSQEEEEEEEKVIEEEDNEDEDYKEERQDRSWRSKQNGRKNRSTRAQTSKAFVIAEEKIDEEEEEEKENLASERNQTLNSSLMRPQQKKKFSVYEDWMLLEAMDYHISKNGTEGLKSKKTWENIKDPFTKKKLFLGNRSGESMRERIRKHLHVITEEDHKTIKEFINTHSEEEARNSYSRFDSRTKKFTGIDKAFKFKPMVDSNKRENNRQANAMGKVERAFVDNDDTESIQQGPAKNSARSVDSQEDIWEELRRKDLDKITEQLMTYKFDKESKSKEKKGGEFMFTSNPIKPPVIQKINRVQEQSRISYEPSVTISERESMYNQNVMQRSGESKKRKDYGVEGKPVLINEAELKKAKIDNYFEQKSLLVSEAFKTKRVIQEFDLPKNDIVIVVNLDEQYRQYVVDESLNESQSQRHIFEKLSNLALKYSMPQDQINNIFHLVSNDFEDLETYLRTRNRALLWEPFEDTDLLEGDPTALRYLRQIKGDERIAKRRMYLIGE